MTKASNGLQDIVEDEGGLSKFAYDAILKMIITRELSAGEVVQERRLAEALDMSRTPIRDTFRRLEAEGWLVRLSPRTIAVKKVSLEEYISALHVRELLEPEAAAIAASRIEETTCREWRQKLKVLAESSERRPELEWEFDQSLHMGIANATNNRVLARIIGELRKITQLFENQTIPAHHVSGYKKHLVIIDAIESRDADAAREAMRSHLRQAKQSIIDAL